MGGMMGWTTQCRLGVKIVHLITPKALACTAGTGLRIANSPERLLGAPSVDSEWAALPW